MASIYINTIFNIWSNQNMLSVCIERDTGFAIIMLSVVMQSMIATKSKLMPGHFKNIENTSINAGIV